VGILFNILKVVHCVIIWYRSEFLEGREETSGDVKISR